MQRGRAVLLVAGVTAAFALLFTFFSASVTGDIVGTDQLLWLPFAALAAAAVVAMSGDRAERFTGLPAVAATAAVVAAVLLTGAITIDAMIAAGNARSLGLDGTIGTGLWLTLFAVVIGLAGVGIGLSRRLS